MNGVPVTRVLKDVNIAIERGHTVGVIGESGCGKSTLARVMSGLLPASQGEVLLDGDQLKPDLRTETDPNCKRFNLSFKWLTLLSIPDKGSTRFWGDR